MFPVYCVDDGFLGARAGRPRSQGMPNAVGGGRRAAKCSARPRQVASAPSRYALPSQKPAAWLRKRRPRSVQADIRLPSAFTLI